MMERCSVGRFPRDQHYTPETFWRALLATAWITGMRKSALLSLRWEDVDLRAGVALSRCRDNKGKRDDKRHRIDGVAGLLAELYAVRQPSDPRVFPWNVSVRTLDRELARIQQAAGIHLPCHEDHEHTQRATCTASTVSATFMPPTTTAGCLTGSCKTRWGTPASPRRNTTSSTRRHTRRRATMHTCRSR